ncbi:sirohydrochlorin chelatase [Streptomyces sp. NBC_01506]|uniref:sirohydrochlorin chelatase n=1 Tax=Streptomyces sp. NBC_01506 TaxID=2903887 RepID=UPI00386BEDDD
MSDRCEVIAVCGHEAAYGRALHTLVDPAVTVVPNGRELYRTLAALNRRGRESCVVPMTLGRDPQLVADTARTLRALPATERSGTVLAEPFGTSQHLIAWLRAAAGRTPDTAALLVTAPAGGPFEDAELYRVASLVRRYGGHALVEVAFTGGDPDLAEGVRRCGLLGASHVVLLPAAFAQVDVPDVPDVRDVPDVPDVPDTSGLSGVRVESAGPSIPPAALARVLAERVADARRRRHEHGDDGIAAGLTAADSHGHSHTHPPGEGHDHANVHAHGHPHPAPARAIRSTA